MKYLLLGFAIFAYLYAAQAKVYFEEKFSDGKFIISILLLYLTGLRAFLDPAVDVDIKGLFQLISDSWEKNWVYSKHPGKEFGKFVRTAGKFFNDEEDDKGKFLPYFVTKKFVD